MSELREQSGDGDLEARAAAHALVRVWLPDRPGALGLVASRVGSVGADIVGIDVLERCSPVAVDEFAVELPALDVLALLVKEIEEVDGVSVEEVRVVASFPDPRLDALESAVTLCEAATVDELDETLVSHSRHEFGADWSALLGAGQLLAASGDERPATPMLEALAAGAVASPMVANGATGPDDLAVATLARRDARLLLGRAGHAFRVRERAQLLGLARVADRIASLLSSR